MLVWLSLAFAIVATIGFAILATIRGIDAFRSVKALSRAASNELVRIEASSASIERHLALAAESGARLDSSVARLRRSRAELNVLTSAIDEVRDSLRRVTAVYPRK